MEIRFGERIIWRTLSGESMDIDPEFQEELLRRVEYLRDEGFIEVIYDPEYPLDLKHAYIREKTDKEIEDEIYSVEDEG